MKQKKKLRKKIRLEMNEEELEEEEKETLSPGLERNGPDDYLVVDCSKSSSNEGSNPEDPLQNLTKNK